MMFRLNDMSLRYHAIHPPPPLFREDKIRLSLSLPLCLTNPIISSHGSKSFSLKKDSSPMTSDAADDHTESYERLQVPKLDRFLNLIQ